MKTNRVLTIRVQGCVESILRVGKPVTGIEFGLGIRPRAKPDRNFIPDKKIERTNCSVQSRKRNKQ